MKTEATAGGPFKLHDIVETVKGARFWGEIVAFDTDLERPGCTVMAIAPGFEGVKHVYPLAQLRLRAHRVGVGALVERLASESDPHVISRLILSTLGDYEQALRWCRPRLSKDVYREQLDRQVSLSPVPPLDEPPVVASDAGRSAEHSAEVPDLFAAGVEAAARFVEQHELLHSSVGDETRRRMEGNRAGLGYAAGIRALINSAPGRASAGREDTLFLASDGRPILVGDIIRAPITINQDVHGTWADYRIRKGPGGYVMSYRRSEKGEVLPPDYTGGYMADLLARDDERDIKALIFARVPIPTANWHRVTDLGLQPAAQAEA